MTVQILGTGCPKCKLLKKNTHEAVSQLEGEISVEDVTDMDTMMDMGMLVSPGFAIDGTLLQTGKVLTTDNVKKLILEHQTQTP